MDELLRQVIQDYHIDRPVLCYRLEGCRLYLWLLGNAELTCVDLPQPTTSSDPAAPLPAAAPPAGASSSRRRAKRGNAKL